MGSHVVRPAGLSGPLDLEELGHEMYACVADLYPICRSITGDGVRATLRRLQRHAPMVVQEVPTGTQVFDWTVPKEWNIRDAYVKNSQGRRVIDFGRSNLHVVNYSVPVKGRMSLSELRPHLFTLPDHPDWVPYRTTYYREEWGFCLRHRELQALEEGEYEVCIDSSLEAGHLTYGELLLPGQTEDEVLISCHVCHPSLANDNLSGVTVAAFLAERLRTLPLRYSYRFLFIPGTIGSITWLARNEAHADRIKHGLVLGSLGDPGSPTYKKSRRGDAVIDRAVRHVLSARAMSSRVVDFSPFGYDERQYCSPGFDLPVGCLMRTPYGEYPQYHTSEDDLDFVHPELLVDSLRLCLETVEVIEHNRVYLNQSPKGEPQLGRRGLYNAMGGFADAGVDEMSRLWILNLSDGQHDLLDIAERSGLGFDALQRAVRGLTLCGLLKEMPG